MSSLSSGSCSRFQENLCVFTPLPSRTKCSSLSALVTSHRGTPRFLGFDIFDDRESLYFVNGNTDTKNRMR